MMSQQSKLEHELESRKRNLAVIQETIQHDSNSGEKLLGLRDFLSQRVQQLERELNQTKRIGN
ncbi:MAG: hypothetical protein JRN52_05775 [Nitrososphaerota archaeon]|nr:hypothetical protein [Nitrososphaerota archaeon]